MFFSNPLLFIYDFTNFSYWTETTSYFDTVIYASPLVCALYLAFVWVIFPSLHFFYFLLFFEIVFLLISADFLIATALHSFQLDNTIFALILVTFAALESLVGLAFLVYFSKTGHISFIAKLNS